MDALSDLPPAPRPKIRIGDVLGRGLRATFANLPAYLGASVAVQLVALVLAVALFGTDFLDPVAAMMDGNADFTSEQFLQGVVLSLLNTFVNIAIIGHLAARLAGQKVGLVEALRAGLPVFWQLWLVGLLYLVGFGLGLVLLVVPGLLFMVCYAVVAPAVVLDRAGILGSFSRSRYLTSGNRWRILGIIVLAVVILVLLSVIVGLPIGLVSVYAADGGLATGIAIAVINAVVNAFGFVLVVCIQTVLHRDLRIIREGESIADVGKAFD